MTALKLHLDQCWAFLETQIVIKNMKIVPASKEIRHVCDDKEGVFSCEKPVILCFCHQDQRN